MANQRRADREVRRKCYCEARHRQHQISVSKIDEQKRSESVSACVSQREKTIDLITGHRFSQAETHTILLFTLCIW